MSTVPLASFERLLGDLTRILQASEGALVSHYSAETAPAEIRLRPLDWPIEPALTGPAAGIPVTHTNPKQPAAFHAGGDRADLNRIGQSGPGGKLNQNALCQDCPERMYPVRQFYQAGSIPVLVVYFAGSFYADEMRRDLSRTNRIGTDAEDELFERMLQSLAVRPTALHYQEFVACHFNPERSSPADWQRRARNCGKHLQHTIETRSIELVILSGPSAVMLLGKETAQKQVEQPGLFALTVSANRPPIPALVLRSASAVLALESRRKLARQQGQTQEYDHFKAQESRIKKQMLQSLQTALQRWL
ncbi:MAG: hypothetical protein KDK39_09345 [Leptospiraceae bacterium]|nr:hypothetical protein [Leptospiraceae bacterium]